MEQNASESIKELTKAMCAVQSKLRGARRETENPFFKSHYADLQSVWEACKDLLAENGLAVFQTTHYISVSPVIPVLVTTLSHTSGEWIRGHYPVITPKQEPQGIGSAITYARRYALAAIIGVYSADDDGEVAMGRNTAGPTIVKSVAAPVADPSGVAPVDFLNAAPEDFVMPFGKDKNKRLAEIDTIWLKSTVDWMRAKEIKNPALMTALNAVISNRPGANAQKVKEAIAKLEEPPMPTDSDIPF